MYFFIFPDPMTLAENKNSYYQLMDFSERYDFMDMARRSLTPDHR